MPDCKICGQYISVHEKTDEMICANCQYRYDMFEANGLELTFCNECIYAAQSDWTGSLDCHRRSPSGLSAPFQKGKWPPMEKNDWCGDGRKRK